MLEMVANIKERGLAKKSAAPKIFAEKERSDKILQRYATSNAMRKQRRSEALENLAPEIMEHLVSYDPIEVHISWPM